MAEYSHMTSCRGERLETATRLPNGAPRGVIQIVHGMCEHIRRYDEAARAFTDAGYIVVGHTQLGHNRESSPLGYFGGRGGWDALAEDVHALRKATEAKYPGLPYFLLGHSMGSFVVRTYCLTHGAGLRGVILSGTGHFPHAAVSFGSLLAKALCAAGREKEPGKLLNAISSAGYCKGYEDVRTPFDWLSRDRAVVEKYMADPLCGYTFTNGAYRDMFDGLSRLYPGKLRTLESDIPVLFISGDADPVGSNGAGVKKVAEEWKKAGVKDVTVKLYPGARHEVLGELNKDEVRSDVIEWMTNRGGK